MNSSEHHLKVNRTARYYTLGEMGPHIREIWYVLHGYGQLAEYFITNFQAAVRKDRLIIAPEALSRFYLNGFSGKIGASWMTKADRISEINDYVDYLDSLHTEIRKNLSSEEINTSILGFSQGTSTAWRWVQNGRIKPDNFIIWAGGIPREEPGKMLKKDSNLNLFMIYGSDDPFVTEEAAKKQESTLRQFTNKLEIKKFQGVHSIDEPSLIWLSEKLRR